jgi:acyl-coenzyme A thioesterase PaaI-like protein
MGFEPQNPEYRKFIEQILKAQPFMMALGAALSRINPGEIELSLTVRADHLQHGGVVHGGVIAATGR